MIESAAAAAGNKPVIVVNCSGSAIALNWEDANIPAVIQAWYPGQRGDAVADVLFGKYNPAGRLPVTFYKATADLPAFTDYATYNRTISLQYRTVLYPFGHGLSYSTSNTPTWPRPTSPPATMTSESPVRSGTPAPSMATRWCSAISIATCLRWTAATCLHLTR